MSAALPFPYVKTKQKQNTLLFPFLNGGNDIYLKPFLKDTSDLVA